MFQQLTDKINQYFKQDYYRIYLIYTGIICFIYSPLVLQNYAFTDDYNILEIGITQTGDLSWWDIMNGRPLFGLFQYITQYLAVNIDFLSWLRAFSIICSISLCIFLHRFLVLKVEIKSSLFTLFLPLFISILPSFIVYNSWATCSVFMLSILLSGLAYHFAFDSDRRSSIIRCIFGITLLICSFFIYQPTGMVFIYFVFLCNCIDTRKVKFKNLVISAFILASAMFASFCAVKILPQLLYGKTFARSDFTHDFIGKIYWFFNEPLMNAINNYNLNPGSIYTILSVLVFLIGLFFICRNNQGFYKLLLTFLFMVVIIFPNLAIKENWASFRSCVGVELIAVTIILLGIINFFFLINNQQISKIFLSCLFLIAAINAQNTIYSFFIQNSQNGYQALTQEIISKIPKNYQGKIRFDLSNKSWPGLSKITRYDEFGSDALNVEWCLRGMAISIKQLKKMDYQIDPNMILKSNEICKDNCIVISTPNIIKKASMYIQ